MNVYDPFARYYDADFADFDEDLAFYREMARRTGGPILEPMCGTGRVLLPLAQQGYEITGIDVSGAMLDRARTKIERASLSKRATLIQGDIRTLELPQQQFAFAFIAVNSFMHLIEVEDQLQALATIKGVLQPEGIFVIDVYHPDPALLARQQGSLELDRSYSLDGHTVYKSLSITNDPARQISDVTWFYDEIGADASMTRRALSFPMRWFYRYELEHLLERSGFRVLDVYGSYDLEEYTSASPNLIVVAENAATE